MDFFVGIGILLCLVGGMLAISAKAWSMCATLACLERTSDTLACLERTSDTLEARIHTVERSLSRLTKEQHDV